jgi:invasion protein IalB
MWRIRLFLVTGILVGILNAGGVVAARSADNAPGSAQKTPPAAADQKAAVQTEPTPLPNGASSINETYGDWTVDCRFVEHQKQCMIVQVQNNQNRRVFEIQLRAPKDAKTEGTILMPFGLKLESGVIMTLDDKKIGPALSFSTCMPQGCLVPVSFPADTVDSMKKSKTLGIASLNVGSGEVVTFKVSLEGFANASARVIELNK